MRIFFGTEIPLLGINLTIKHAKIWLKGYLSQIRQLKKVEYCIVMKNSKKFVLNCMAQVKHIMLNLYHGVLLSQWKNIHSILRKMK